MVRRRPAKPALHHDAAAVMHESVFVPLAKWAMLLTGNYRCVTPEGPRSIHDAVHSDLAASAEMSYTLRAAGEERHGTIHES